MSRREVRVLVAGVCGSGKSTLARLLTQAGFPARALALEHSRRAEGWPGPGRRRLVFLDCDWRTTLARGKAGWDPERHRRQRERLRRVREAADLYVITDGLSPDEVCRRVRGHLERTGEDRTNH